jgi:hypothetical protein
MQKIDSSAQEQAGCRIPAWAYSSQLTPGVPVSPRWKQLFRAAFSLKHEPSLLSILESVYEANLKLNFR